MSVDAEGRACILMPHAAGNGYRVDAVGKQRAGVRVPQVVKAYTFKAVRIRKVAEPAAGRVMMQGSSLSPRCNQQVDRTKLHLLMSRGLRTSRSR